MSTVCQLYVLQLYVNCMSTVCQLYVNCMFYFFLADEDHYLSLGGKIPEKWNVSETIRFKKYSTASDVWIYDCGLYEIWSLGHKPFESRTNIEVTYNY